MATRPFLPFRQPPYGKELEGTALLDLLIWLMLSIYLYVDTLNGLARDMGAGEAPLSPTWKGAILLLILIASLRRSLTTLLLTGASALLLLAGPIYQLLETGVAADFGWEAATAMKPVLPIAILSWCNDQQTANPGLLRTWPRRVLWLSVIAVIINVVVGLAGYGFASYETRAGRIGIIGFFYAGNEVGAMYAVLCGFLFMEIWVRHRRLYLPVVLIAMVIGFVIATKSAILSAIALAPLVPLAYQRGRWLRMPAGLALGLLAALVVLIIAAIQVWTILDAAGLAAKLQEVYQTRGWAGILFSGRDVFIASASGAVWGAPDMGDALFGPGVHALSQLGIKESVEIDPFDFYLWFGAPGLIFLILFVGLFLYVPLLGRRDPTNHVAPTVLMTTYILLGIATVAGHVILGGMAGILWAVFIAMVFTSGKLVSNFETPNKQGVV